MLTLIDKYIHNEIPDLPQVKNIITTPDKLYFIYDTEYRYGRFPKTYKDLIFRNSTGIYVIKDIKTKNNDNDVIFIVSYEIILHRTYFDHLIKEILIKILINLNTSKDINNYLKAIGPVSTEPEFNRLWLAMSRGKHQNPKYMSERSRGLISDFIKEYKSIRKYEMVETYEDDDNIYVKPEYRIPTAISKATLDVYDKSYINIYLGNLYDEPYHGRNLIDSWRCIYNK